MIAKFDFLIGINLKAAQETQYLETAGINVSNNIDSSMCM